MAFIIYVRYFITGKMNNPKTKQKRKYCGWTPDDMERALTAYKEKQCGFNECCRRYNIAKPTFRRHLHCLNKKANEKVQSMGRLTVFTADIEKELANHILKLEERFFGVTISDVRRLAFQIAVRNNIPHNFNMNKQMAGKAWYYSFMKRHDFLSLRQPEKISMARASGFNKQNVYEFFNILEKCVDENGFTALTIFNVDESGFSTVQKKNQKIIAKRGKHQVGGISSGERGVNTTIVCCASAAGQCIPPMIIFKRKRMAPELAIGASPGAIVTISDTGYINTELFVTWLEHFIKHVKPSPENKMLLLLDGHTTHSKNLDALILARQHGVVLLQLPGHTTHRLQPLDVSFFKPMETYFSQAVETFLRTNPGSTVSQYNMTVLLSDAFAKTATISTIANGFKKSGIWPVDRTVFAETDFVAASILLEKESNNNDVSENSIQAADIQNQMRVKNTENDRKSMSVNESQLSQSNKHDLYVPIDEIYPLPEQLNNENKRKLSQPAVILSSTPYKDDLENQQSQRRNKAKQVKRKICKPSTSSNATKQSRSSSVIAPQSIEPVQENNNIEICVNPNDWFCHVCEENIVEDMVQCLKCKKWAHTSCAGSGKKLKKYKCENCI